MTRDVLITISGFQTMDGDQDDIEVITTGDYFWKNGKHYVIYDEIMEGFEENIHNQVKITPDEIDIQKRGMIGAHMIFERNKKNQTRYVTPMGEMVIEIHTGQIALEEQEDRLKVSIRYSLGINYQHVSDCCLTMDICSRGKAQLRL